MADQTKKNSIKRNDNLKKYIAVIFVCVTMLGMACGQKPDSGKEREELPQLIIGSDNYEPYNYLDDDGNPAGIDVELAQRIIDFTSGACYSLGGTLQKVSSYIFVLGPYNVDITGDLQNILGGSAPSVRAGY